MNEGEKTQSAGVVRRAEHSWPAHGPRWDALRANAIGSLWGRPAPEQSAPPGR
ncbi:hypothetical protein [Mycolicibacterium frederiksbergense]|uniref:hypothetical protein n=1 Tax=Mycolicibacterium frederiksbergense TaxID=117567 RepID=UPI00265D4BED|nr:hypothetical protein [Mycolicibacterium frederiksbergense]